jgi:DivIVA domain-containing protein
MGSTAELLSLAVVVAIVLGGLVAVVVGQIGIGDPEVPVDAGDDGLPDGPLHGTDLPRLRFGLALRGYRMAEVDTFVDRVGAELDARDAELARYRPERAVDEESAAETSEPAEA